MVVDPPKLTIRRPTGVADPVLLAGLAGAQTGHVVDALGGGGALASVIKPVDPAKAGFVGRALTCETGPGDNLAIAAALALARPGDVVVAAASGFTGSAIVGDNIAWMARNAGVVAIVTDGAARDSAGIVGVGLPVFCAAITPNSCARSGPGSVGLPVTLGGVAVATGDLIVGDADGVVVIPADRAGSVLARLAEVRAAELALQARIGDGMTRFDSVAALLASDQVRYVA